MNRKKLKSSRFVAAFALTMVIFLAGYILGTIVNEHKLQRVYDLEQDIRIESLGNELVHDLVTQDLCDNINLTSYTEELTELGKRLTYMESIYGFDSPQVMNLKNYYSLLLIRHWVINEQAHQQCNTTKSTVIYFYTNYGDCVDCEDQGLVLTNIHRNYPFFNTYSFEFHQDNPAMRFLKEKYQLSPERLPTLIIDDTVHYGFRSKDFLMTTLNLKELEQQQKDDHPEWYD